MYQGEEIIFKEEDLPVAKTIINELEMQDKLDYKILCSNKSKKEINFGLHFTFYLNFLKSTQNQSFIIKTNKKEYKCSIFGVYSSKVLASLLQNDPKITTYKYDFDDELDEFQLICNIFNFKEVQITSNNMYILQEIVNDLQITYLNEKILNFIDEYEKVSQTIDDEQTIVDSIEVVFNWLYKIKELNVETVRNYIIDSCWIQTDENVQELTAFLLQVINCDSTYHPYLLDLIIQLDKESNETNSLKILIPFIIQKLFMSFGDNLLNCSFVYNLFKKGLISKEKLRSKFIEIFKEENNLNKKGYSYYEPKIDNFSKKKQNLMFWFYPELNSIDEIASQINQNNGKPNNSFLILFFPDNPDAYERMRDSGEPDDELTKALRYDDVDTLQLIINKNGLLLENKTRPLSLYSYNEYNQKKLSNARVPYNIYEDFVPNGQTNYINYASAYGSLKCFKYLLLNHENVDQTTFELAVFGGNIEIIKIVSQNINKEQKYNYYNKDVKELLRFPSVMKHQNDIFDWIFQEKYKGKNVNDDSIYKLLLSTATNGNAHALITIIDEGYNFMSHLHEIVRLCSKNGFYLFTKLFINIFKAKKSDMIMDYSASVYFGNLSIFKLYRENIKTDYNLNSALSTAIEHNYMNIIHYFFDSFASEDFIIKQYVVYSCLSSAVLAKNNDLFNYLIEQFKIINPNFFSMFKKQYDLLSMSCLLGLDETDKTITNLIIENNTKTDFTTPFFNAAIAGKYEICKYFIDKKLFINYEKLSSQISQISSIKNEIFSLIVDNSDPESKEVFLNTYIEQALLNNNKELVKYLIKKGACNEKSFFIAVNLQDIELIDMILDKNPSFINKRSKNGTILYIAVKNNDLKLVQHLLKVPGINPGLFESDNRTPLIAAVSNLNFEILNEILCFYGNNIQNEMKQFDEALKTVLKAFLINNNKPNTLPYNRIYGGFPQKKVQNTSFDKTKIILILKRLLEIKTIDPNCIFNDSTILSYACENNELEIVELLLQLDKIDVNLCSLLTGNSPLILAIEKNNLEIAEILIKYPRTNINIMNFKEQTALTISVSKNLDNIVNLLIKDEKFDPIESGINYAFFISTENLAKMLISSKSLDVNYEIDEEITEEDNNKIGKSYEEYKNMNLKYFKLREKRAYITTLIDSINNNYLEKVDLIIHHQSFNSVKSQLKRSIFASVKQNKIEIFKKLIQLYNNDVNIFNCNGESLLFVAVSNESIDIFTEILNNPSFDANKSCFLDSFIETIVKNNKSSIKIINEMYKFDKEHDHFIDFTKLLPNGRSFFTSIASENLFQNEGDEIDDLDFIYEKNLAGVGEIVTFLIENGVDPNTKDNDGFLPLEYAILLNSSDFVHTLISSNKIDLSQKVQIKEDFFRLYENQYDNTLNFSDSKITTYLHLAARSRNPDVFKEFIDNKLIDVNSTDDMNETVLIVACSYNRIKNVQILSQVDDLDYLHKNAEGKDAIEIISNSIDKEIEINEIKTKDEYFAALISMLNSTIHCDSYNYLSHDRALSGDPNLQLDPALIHLYEQEFQAADAIPLPEDDNDFLE